MGQGRVLIIGSAPEAPEAAAWDRSAFDTIVVINNAWRIRPDWDALVYPADFPAERLPPAPLPDQQLIGEAAFVPAQNAFGGFVYGGGTMAFTAGYWALYALRPRVLAWFGCDMVYPPGRTHFYGAGRADPLRPDVTLQSLEAKAARLMAIAATEGCSCLNLSAGESRLVFPRATLADLMGPPPPLSADPAGVAAIRAAEARIGYFVPSGRYWEVADTFRADTLARLDQRWLALRAQAAGAA